MIMQHQQRRQWCWAAVAASIHDFLHAGAGQTQAQLATLVLVDEGQITSGVDCVASPALCDHGAALNDALRITTDLAPDGFKQNHHLFFDSIKRFVDAELPVGVRIAWWGGGAHFVAIDGYREFASGQRQVRVQDPWYGPSYQNYADIVSGYPPGGSWHDTYLVEG